MIPATFTCEICRETYSKDQTDEEAKAEFDADYGDEHDIENADVICEDCYQQFKLWEKGTPSVPI